MHPEALDWVRRWATDEPLTVLDIGGRYINGSSRDLFPAADWTVLDIAPGDNVHIVADAAAWTPDREYDLVVCTEVFEHTGVWREIIASAFSALRPGGRLVVTCAGPGRGAHSGVDGHWGLYPGEHYANVGDDELAEAMTEAGFTDVKTEQAGLDTRGTAVRP